jgi:hypothetical protein
MMNLEGNKFDVSNATGKGTSYRYFGATKFLPIFKNLFVIPLNVKKRSCRYEIYK